MLKRPCLRWISLSCGAIAACSSGDGERRGDAPSPPSESTFSPVERSPSLALRLDRVVYDAGDALSVTLVPSGVDLGPGPLTVALAAPDTGDVELIASIADGIAGNTICALGDAAAWPTLAFLTKFRDEFEAMIRSSTFVAQHRAVAEAAAFGAQRADDHAAARKRVEGSP